MLYMLKNCFIFAGTVKMISMHNEDATARDIAASLLQINAIKLNVKNPFTWASGLRSPIYCDNRQILSFPELRTAVADQLAAIILREFPACEVVAGVASGAIAIGVLVAERLQKPFVYVRPSPKGHGLQNRIEGKLPEGTAVVVVEDLISTGKSSLEAVDAIRDNGSRIIGMVAIFTYEFEQAIQSVQRQDVPLFTLSNYSCLIQLAVDNALITEAELAILKDWRKNPHNYSNDNI